MSILPSALILAGSRSGGDPLARHAGVEEKALIPINGTPMLDHVIEALRKSGVVGSIAVSAGNPAVAAGRQLIALPSADSPSRSVGAAIRQLGTPLLVTTADHPLLKPDWIRYFIGHLPDASAVAALARSEVVLAAAPGTQRTFLRFRGAAYSGCNLFFFRDEAALGAVEFWQRMENERKHPLRMVRQLGPGVLASFLLGRLTIDRALSRLGSLAGASLGIVEIPFGESAIDVDKPADLELVRRLMASRRDAA